MEQLYIKLNDLMGEKADARFEYVYDVTYTPYKAESADGSSISTRH